MTRGKRTAVAIAVVVALGAVWAGAAWFTGRQVERHLDDITAEANARLNAAYPDAGLKVSYRDYHRGWFHSQLTYVLQSNGAANGEQLLAAGQDVVLDTRINHGPFPLSELKQAHLLPAMATVHVALANNDTLKALFELTKGQPFFSIDSRIAYSGDSRSALTLLPLDVGGDDRKLAFSGASLQLALSDGGRATHFTGAMNQLALTKKNPWGQQETVDLQGLTLDFNTRQGQFGIDPGTGKVALKSLALNVQGSAPLTLNDVTLTNQLAEDKVNLSGQLALAVSAVNLRDQNLGAIAANLSFKQFDGQGVKQFASEYREKMNALMQQAPLQTPEAYQQQAMMVLLHNLPQLLKGNPSVTLSPVSWENGQGESTFNLALELSDPLQQNAATADASSDEEAIIRQSVKKLDAKLNAPLDMLTELMVQTAPPAGSDDEKKQQATMARQQVQLLANIGQMSQVTETKDNAITAALQYADGVVTFNGRQIPLAEFIAPYLMPSDGNAQ